MSDQPLYHSYMPRDADSICLVILLMHTCVYICKCDTAVKSINIYNTIEVVNDVTILM